MKLTQLFTKTRRNVPSDEQSKNAQLLIQAGYIHKEMAGVYSYLPLGKKVIDNITNIIRSEINKIDGQEVSMTALQNRDIWEITGRWDDAVVDNWFKTKLLNGTEVGIGWSHEEPITNMLKSYVSSYKDLPLNIYQFQTKFRNELRAKSGLLRGREFYMKDLYSFSRNQKEHDEYYERAKKAYVNIYKTLGLGDITYLTFASGGYFSKYSHEFQTLSDVGEDTVYVHKDKKLAINKEVYNDGILRELGINKDELIEERAVEVGNIFSLGSKYTDALGLYYIDKAGQRQSITMGCYGIGISRLMGLMAEHFADKDGLVWPEVVSPAAIILLRLGEEDNVVEAANKLYKSLTTEGIEVIYDDRDIRPGEKFSDADLFGIPYRVVVSQQTVEKQRVELKKRTEQKSKLVTLQEIVKIITKT
jgi:prolyl-tRNA synthetase